MMHKKGAIFDKKNVLVIGGAGFLGSHLCDELVKRCKVICVDNFLTGDEKNIDHLLAETDFKFIKHDIFEPLDLSKYRELEPFKIEFQGIQEIYHLACPTSPKDFEKNRIATILANSYGIRNGLELAVRYQAKFLFFSSAVVYGPRRDGNEKIRESDIGRVDPLSKRGSYDEGKRFAEMMVANYRDVFRIEAKILRLFRTYGPRMKLRDNQMIPDMISNALDNKDIEICGGRDFSSSFCYVTDAVDAALKLMDKDLAGPVNIGSDVDVNVTVLAEKIKTLVGSKSEITYQDGHFFLTPLPLPDISLARNELNWMPIVTLEKGLEKTIYDLRASKGVVGVREALRI